jgi:large exoprotein involved in heme utilization and adhesion
MDARTANNQPGGDIRLDLGQLTLLSGGQINTTSEGPGPAGTIALTAQKQIQTSGTDSTYASRRTQFGTAVAPASANSGLYVRSTSTGAAGNILLTPPPAPPWISRAKSTRNRRLATAATWC